MQLGLAPALKEKLGSSAASAIRSRMVYVQNELSRIDKGRVNWPLLAYNLRLIVDDFVSSLSESKRPCTVREMMLAFMAGPTERPIGLSAAPTFGKKRKRRGDSASATSKAGKSEATEIARQAVRSALGALLHRDHQANDDTRHDAEPHFAEGAVPGSSAEWRPVLIRREGVDRTLAPDRARDLSIVDRLRLELPATGARFGHERTESGGSKGMTA